MRKGQKEVPAYVQNQASRLLHAVTWARVDTSFTPILDVLFRNEEKVLEYGLFRM